MKIFRFLFILCLPTFLLHPIPAEAFHPEPVVQNEESQKSVFENPRDEFGKVNPWVLLQPENLSVDRYFAFIDLIKDEAFLESLSEEEFDGVVDFVTHMVQASVPESLEDLKDAYDAEIDQLMEDLYGEPKWSLSYRQGFDFEIVPALSCQRPETLLCKNWFKKKAHYFPIFLS